MASNRTAAEPLVAGAAVGIISWLLGYAITYLFVAPSIRESTVHQLIETVDGEPATYEMVGWVFYNAHFVNTLVRDIPVLGTFSTSFIGGEEGYALLLHGVPIGILLLAGFILARSHGATTPTEGASAGVTVIPGYLLVSLAGVFVFEVTFGQASGAPEFLPSIVVAGLAVPILAAGGGGAIAGFVDRRLHRSDDTVDAL